MKYCVFLTILMLPVCLFSQNKRLYVDAGAGGANTGAGWADAFTNLHAALALAQAGDTVWVAAGVYRPAAGADRDSSFRPASGVRLYGGFAGHETDLDQRDWKAYPTVLSGDVGIPGDSTDNSYTIMYLDQPDSMTIVDGFVFRHGSATTTLGEAVASPRRSGGALYIMGADGEAYAVIRHCRFEHNRARSHGGAVYINGTQNGSVAPQFLDCEFYNNSAGSDGGAVYRNGSSWAERAPDFGHCRFEQNQAGRYGGGLHFQDAERADTFQLDHCQFLNNRAENIGGGSMLFASRIVGASVSVNNCVYEENEAEDGAALAIWSSGFSSVNYIRIENSLFEKNNSKNYVISISCVANSMSSVCSIFKINVFKNNLNNLSGNTIHLEMPGKGNVNISESRFFDNTGYKVILASEINDFRLNGCLFERNTGNNIIYASSNISAIEANNILLKNNYYDNTQNAIYISSYIQFRGENITFSDSNLFFVIMPHSEDIKPEPIIINNSILNKTKLLASKDGGKANLNLTLSHTALHNTAFSCADLPPGVCGPGMIEGVDPMFVNPDSGDFRLQPCSPLVNAGSNALVSPANIADLAGSPRIAGGTVDMGAYETPEPTLAAEPAITPACPGTNSGAAAIETQNGCPPFHFAWTSATGNGGDNLTGLPAGEYTLTVTDARGTAFTLTFSIPPGNDNDLAFQAGAVICGDTAGGSARVVPLNAQPPYAYLWSNGAADSLLRGLAAGHYLVTVTDALGCSAAGAVEVPRSGSLDVQLLIDPITCPGDADGSLTVLPNNGKAPFAWAWENGPAGPTHAPLGPGTYLGTLTDALGCHISWILPLSDPQPISFQVAVVPASGPTAPDGAAVLDGLGGGTPPLLVLWSNGAAGLATDSLAPGLYSVTVSDANGCQKTASFEVPFSVGADGQLPMQERVRLFPNPAQARATVLTDDRVEPFRLRVYDARGRLQLDAPSGTSSFDVRNWPAGIYRVEVWMGDALAAVKKLTVMRFN